MRSAVKRVTLLLRVEPAAISLDVEAISARLAAVNPMAVGMTPKRLANVRSDFLAALKVTGAILVKSGSKSPLRPPWTDLFARLSGRRAHIGLSRLARYASARGIAPQDVDDQLISAFIATVRAQSLCARPTVLHRQVTRIWNEAAGDPALGLQTVTVPPVRAATRIDWARLSDSFRQDVDDYLCWCAVVDPFAPDARPRPLAPRTRRLRRDQIHAAVTSLIKSGTEPSSVRSLAELVSPTHFKGILRTRLNGVSGKESVFNHDVGKALIQIGHEWVKVDARHFAELKRLMGKMPAPLPGLTSKNRQALRQFNDAIVLRRLYWLPERLWGEVRRDARQTFRTLAKAQAALALAILCYMPVRLQNLALLEFDTHVFLRGPARGRSTLELPAYEVKNRRELGFDIPPTVAKMLAEYRDRLVPKIIGGRPTRLFVNIDGSPKNPASLASLVTTYLRKRAGIVLTPHQFRHLSAKVILDQESGAFATVMQLLGHTSLKTTISAYAGIDSARAARRHRYLVEQALAAEIPARRAQRHTSQGTTKARTVSDAAQG
jgi:integrase